jgi:hypothetical protein
MAVYRAGLSTPFPASLSGGDPGAGRARNEAGAGAGKRAAAGGTPTATPRQHPGQGSSPTTAARQYRAPLARYVAARNGEPTLMLTNLLAPLCLLAPQGPQFAEPVRITAGDAPIKVEAPGFAAPAVHDVDGDGVLDLVVGQFNKGKIAVYKGSGKGAYAARTWLQADGANAEIPGVW